jgi:hypothetical protein
MRSVEGSRIRRFETGVGGGWSRHPVHAMLCVHGLEHKERMHVVRGCELGAGTLRTIQAVQDVQ